MTQESGMQTTLAQPSHMTKDDLRQWLARHGVELGTVRRMEIVCGYTVPEGARHQSVPSVYLRVERYLTDADGRKFLVFEDGERQVAMEAVLFPILDLP